MRKLHATIVKPNRFVVLTGLLFLILIIMVNYALSYYFFNFIKRPFDLSSNGIAVRQEQAANQAYSEFIDINNKQVRLILSREGSDAIGLFDPDALYYQHATKVTDMSSLRYFSNKDYQNSNNVSIAVSKCDIFNPTGMSVLSERYHTTIINCLQDSPLTYDNTVMVKNLFTFQVEQGDTLYIDSEDRSKVNDLKNELKQFGFVEVKEADKNFNILSAVSFANESRYQQFIIIAAISSILLYIVICYTVIMKNRKKMQVSMISGANFWTMLVKLYGSDWIKSIVLCALASSYILVLEALNYNYTSLVNIMKLYVCYIVYITTTYLVFYTLMYHQVKRRLR